MEKLTSKSIAMVGVMAALSNVLSFIYVPLAPGVNLYFLVQVPYFIAAMTLGPLAGALAGLLGTLTMAYTVYISKGIGGVFIPVGNAILAGVTGFIAEKVKIFDRLERGEFFWPVACAAVGEFAEAPYIFVTLLVTFVFMVGMELGVAMNIIFIIMGKAMIEVLLSSFIVAVLLGNPSVRTMLQAFRR